MKRSVVLAAVVALCLSCAGCAVFTVNDRVTEDGRHVRSISLGRSRPSAKYVTSEPDEQAVANPEEQEEQE